jgi:hypothetical protein
MSWFSIELSGPICVLTGIVFLSRRLPAARRRRARKQALAGTVVLATIPGLSYACNAGDPPVRVKAPFRLYQTFLADQGGVNPLGYFTSGDACIDNNLNQGVSPPQGWTWIYFKSGLRDFSGVAPLSAFQGIAAADPAVEPDCPAGTHIVRRAYDAQCWPDAPE